MIDRTEDMERIAAGRTAEVMADAGAQDAEQLGGDHVEDPADLRLRAADEILRQTRDVVAGTVQATDEPADLRTRLRDGVDALYTGDMDAAVDALAEAVKPDVKALAAQVVREVDLQAGLSRFKERYPEIIADVHLAKLADAYYEKARAAGSGEAEALEAAGRETRAHLRRGLGVVDADVDTGEPITEPDRSGVISEMRRARVTERSDRRD